MVSDDEQVCRLDIDPSKLFQDSSLRPSDICEPPSPLQSDDSSDFDIEDDGLLKKKKKSSDTSSTLQNHTLSNFQLAALSFYWFGWSLLWMPLLVIIMPLQIVSIAGDASKGSSLGTTLLLGSLVSLFCSPIFGAMSDASSTKYVSRLG